MKKHTIKFSLLLAITVGLFITACSNDEWDKHYNNTDVVLSNQSLSEVIKNEANLSIFYRLMEISGYDKILASSQTFTVWAPLDNDSAWNSDYGQYKTMNPSSISSKDTLNIKKLIGNHISRFTYPTSGLDSQRLYLMCNKIQDFKLINRAAYFGKVQLGSDVNIPAKNGILHKVLGYNPYIPGHWEFLTTYLNGLGMDSINNYFTSLIYEDEYGDQVNTLFTDYAKLDNDDSTYTFLAINDVAWGKAVKYAALYHKVYDDTKQLTYAYSRKAIISDLFFSKVSNPIGLDSIISTNKTVFHNVDNLFVGATKYQLSNGPMFITDTLRMKAIDSWHKTIVVEAEKNTYGRSSSFCDLYNRSYIGTSFDISGDKYIYMKSNGSSNIQKATVSFNIPDVLSAKYNLYVVFVPERVENSDNPKPALASVKISYRSAKGSIPLNPIELKKNLAVSGDVIQKQFIGTVTFPWCSMYEKGNPNNLDVKVIVENTVTRTDTKNTRDLRIDCVILEPVE